MTKKKKRGRGRPYAGGETPKRYFRMTDADYARVKKDALRAGKTVSEWIRERLVGKSEFRRAAALDVQPADLLP